MEYTCEDLFPIVGRQDALYNTWHTGPVLSKACRDLKRSKDPERRQCYRTGSAICESVRELGIEASTDKKGGGLGLAQVPRFFVVVMHTYDEQQTVYGAVPWKELLLDIMQPLPDGELRTPLTEFVHSGAIDVSRLPLDDIDCFYCPPNDMGIPPKKDNFQPRVHWTGIM